MIYIYAGLALAALVAAVYALWLRPWLKGQAWAKPFFAWVEPLEIALFKNSETILFARLKVAVGLLLAALTYMSTFDITPILPLLPEAWRPHAQAVMAMLPLILSLVGMADERLRNTTTKPLELVALPLESKPIPPQVAIAVAEADIAKEAAVEVVKAREAA
jgi:hypothetical protein